MACHFYHGTSTRPLVHLYETIITPSNKSRRHTNNTREALWKMVSTRRTPRPQTLSPITLPPVITITRTTTCLDLNLPERQVMCQKCLKVLSSTPDYDRTNPAHRRRRLSYVHSSFLSVKSHGIPSNIYKRECNKAKHIDVFWPTSTCAASALSHKREWWTRRLLPRLWWRLLLQL
jgi:hypothetical protein